MSADYESVLCVKNEVHVFRIPPRTTNRGYKASDWNLDNPDWTGRMRIVAKGKDLSIKLEDKNSGELFARAPIDEYPGVSCEGVIDSSRYFVLRIKDDSGRSAFIGMGFQDRGDSFDLNVALQDHFKWLRQSSELEAQEKNFVAGPKLDLGFKEGQTIKLNLQTKRDDCDPIKTRPRPTNKGGTIGILPPPPGGIKIPGPAGSNSRPHPHASPKNVRSETSQQPTIPQQSVNPSSKATSNEGFLFDLNAPVTATTAAPPSQADMWGDFTTANAQNDDDNDNSWVTF